MVPEKEAHSSETVSLPKDDPEVVAYLARQTQPEVKLPVETNGHSTTDNKEDPPKSIAEASYTAAPTNLPPRKGPLKRKPRQSLEAMSAALDKGKKMTTLEKVSPPHFILHHTHLLLRHSGIVYAHVSPKWIGNLQPLQIRPFKRN